MKVRFITNKDHKYVIKNNLNYISDSAQLKKTLQSISWGYVLINSLIKLLILNTVKLRSRITSRTPKKHPNILNTIN
ncbi:hypothetical protein HZS_1760 [Henneguya salminicola]|nr:hypothetical protein HZS_1760 [Henneguya salminicola]